MKTVKEIEKFISEKAKEHAAAEDEWEYETIEIDSFCEIIQFLLKDDFVVDGIDYQVLLEGYDEESEKDPDKESWYYYEKLVEIMEDMKIKGTLPTGAHHLYTFWQDTIWGQYEDKD